MFVQVYRLRNFRMKYILYWRATEKKPVKNIYYSHLKTNLDYKNKCRKWK